MQKSITLLAISVFSVLVQGCASNYADESKEGKPTMMELHEAHIAGIYGNKVDKSRAYFGSIEDKRDRRIDFYDDLRLPNPELEMIVFPKRNGDGSVQPQQSLKFSMYQQVHYKIGQY